MKAKAPRESEVIMTEMVLPHHTNPLGLLLGGQLVNWMDMAAAISAQSHAEMAAVTASIEKINFLRPVFQGEIVKIIARPIICFRTSIQIAVEVWKRPITTGFWQHLIHSQFTFVGIDKEGKAQPVPAVIPESPEEIRLYKEAERLRELAKES